jgi:hypothetical protein
VLVAVGKRLKGRIRKTAYGIDFFQGIGRAINGLERKEKRNIFLMQMKPLYVSVVAETK